MIWECENCGCCDEPPSVCGWPGKLEVEFLCPECGWMIDVGYVTRP